MLCLSLRPQYLGLEREFTLVLARQVRVSLHIRLF